MSLWEQWQFSEFLLHCKNVHGIICVNHSYRMLPVLVHLSSVFVYILRSFTSAPWYLHVQITMSGCDLCEEISVSLLLALFELADINQNESSNLDHQAEGFLLPVLWLVYSVHMSDLLYHNSSCHLCRIYSCLSYLLQWHVMHAHSVVPCL